MSRKVYEEIASYCKKLSNEGLVAGNGGNVSVRKKDKIYITSTGSDFSNLDENKICTINSSGEKISDEELKPSCEWRMHLQCYRSRPEVKCVVHTHPIFATILGISSEEKLSVSYELIASLETSNITKVKYFSPGSKKLAEEIGKEISDFEGVILAGHGLLTVGGSIEEASERSILLERESKRWIFEKILKKLSLIDKNFFNSLKYTIEI